MNLASRPRESFQKSRASNAPSAGLSDNQGAWWGKAAAQMVEVYSGERLGLLLRGTVGCTFDDESTWRLCDDVKGIILAGGSGTRLTRDPRRQQAAAAHLRQADDLLPALAR